MKFCPYACNVQSTQKTKREYDDEGRETSQELKEINIRTPIPCKGENCGAYRDGACRYGE